MSALSEKPQRTIAETIVETRRLSQALLDSGGRVTSEVAGKAAAHLDLLADLMERLDDGR